MGRPSNRDARRGQIVQGLLAVMARDGYEGASTVAIAREAGLAPGLVHYHFGSKQEVLVALVERLTGTARARYAARAARAGADPWRRLEAFLDAWVGLGPGADPAAVAAWNVVGAEAVRQAPVRALYAAAVAAQQAELVRLARACAPGLPRARVQRVAATLGCAIEGAFRLASAAPGALPRGFAAPALREVARRLLEGGEGRR